MGKLNWLIQKSENSPFYLWVLNKVAARTVPFNSSHDLTIQHITRQSIHVLLPYKRSNLNHIKGIHACALATLSEYCTGLVLLSALDPALYRIILKSIHITYHYQAKTSVNAKFELSQQWIKENIEDELKNLEAIFTELKIEVYDVNNNHICTGLIHWQIKSWKNVKTKVQQL